jgi:O-6-methylguanine DNA methyltransferase
MKTFQQKVLELTRKIPKGKVTTYNEIARKLNCKAYRAVGNALNKNKRPDIYPCYKVIKASGEVGGFASGVKKKIKKLKQEGIEVKNRKIDKKYIYRFK